MWIVLGFIYAFLNAFYTSYNDARHYNGYLLGIWRGFGISFIAFPLLFTLNINIQMSYFIILIIQGLLIGIYDSHIFFASAKFGSNSGNGFMTTAVLTTVLLWWGIHISDFQLMIQNKPYFLSLMFILIGYTITYWKMFHVKINKKAEKYLYPAVFSLSFMSIITHYIAINGKTTHDGMFYYLTLSCFISGLYNFLQYIKLPKTKRKSPKPNLKEGIWLIILSTALISAKTEAFRLCPNPGYVVAILLTSPIISEIIKTHRLHLTPIFIINIGFLILLLLLTG